LDCPVPTYASGRTFGNKHPLVRPESEAPKMFEAFGDRLKDNYSFY